MRKEDAAVKPCEICSDGSGDLVAKDSDGADSSGEPKRARFLDVFIAHRLQTCEVMAVKEIWKESFTKLCIRGERA